LFKNLFQKRAIRVEHTNLFDQLCNISACYDLRNATDEQMIRLWLNTTRLVDGVLKEMEIRGMDVENIIDISKQKLEDGSLQNDPSVDRRIL